MNSATAIALGHDGGDISPTAAREPLLAAVRRIADEDLAPLVAAIDRDGVYPEAVMRRLGSVGAFAAHHGGLRTDRRPDLVAAVEAMAIIGAKCLSTAFCMWCQDACGWYLEHTDNAPLRDRIRAAVASGRQLGGTGLSNPMKALSGIEPLKLKGHRAAGGWVVSGALPWVSNLGHDHCFGMVFEDADRPGHRVMALASCDAPGVRIVQNAHFSALEGTRTFSVVFRKAFLPDEAVLAEPADAMLRRVKAGFILLQAGMALGLIEGCVRLMRESDMTHAAINAYLPARPEGFEAALGELRRRLGVLAATPVETAAGYMRQVLELRLDCSEEALKAASAAMLHAGARGYIAGAPEQRRLRESYFVAIVTPATKHLRKELLALDAA